MAAAARRPTEGPRTCRCSLAPEDHQDVLREHKYDTNGSWMSTLPSYLEHVGHDGSFALDVDAAVAIVLADRWLAVGLGLKLTGSLRDKTQLTVWCAARRSVGLSQNALRLNRQRDLIVGCDEAALAVPLLWKRLQFLVKTKVQRVKQRNYLMNRQN